MSEASTALKWKRAVNISRIVALALTVIAVLVLTLPRLLDWAQLWLKNLRGTEALALSLFLVTAMLFALPAYYRVGRGALKLVSLTNPPPVFYLWMITLVAAIAAGIAFCFRPELLEWATSRWQYLVLVIAFICAVTGWLLVPVLSSRKGFRAIVEKCESDLPITEMNCDELRRGGFIRSLAQAVYRVPHGESAVIGIYGSWGEGKTSALELLRAEMKKRQGVVIVGFDPWSYAGEQAILAGFFNQVSAALKEEPGGFEIGRLLQKLATSLAVTLPSAKLSLSAPFEESLAQRKERLGNALKRAEMRMAVFLDDVDRLTVAELLAVFKLVRVNANLPNVVFLLAMDVDRVKKTLENGGHDSGYVNKVVQIPRWLPVPSEGELLTMLEKRLRQLIESPGPWTGRESELNDEAYRNITEAIRFLVRTPREVKLIINQVNWQLTDLSRAIRLSDLLGMSALEVLAPTVIKDIRENREYYVRLDDITQLRLEGLYPEQGEKRQGQDRAEEHITDILKSLPDEDAKRAGARRNLLAKLFFIRLGPILENTSYGNYAQYRIEKRIATLEVLNFYLQQQAAPGALPDHEIEDQIRKAGRESDPAKYFEQMLDETMADGTAEQLLDGMLLFKRHFTEESALALTQTIALNAHRLSTAGDPFRGEYAAALRLFLRLANDKVDEVNLRDLLIDSITNTPDLYFAYEVCYVLDTKPGETEGTDRLMALNILDELVAILLSRVKVEIIEAKRDIVELAPRYGFWRRLLDIIATNWWKRDGAYDSVVRPYIEWLVGRSPRNLAVFVDTFVEHPPPLKPTIVAGWKEEKVYDLTGLADKAIVVLHSEQQLDENTKTELRRFITAMKRQDELPASDKETAGQETSG